MTVCKRCILTDTFPGIWFAEDGICNYCHEWDRQWANFNFDLAEKELKEIFRVAKAKKRQYDCLLPYSGGRDSSYVVYLCKYKYGLNPLVITFNNLFMSAYAKNNIFSMVDILNVDHIYFTFQPALLKKYYKATVAKCGEFCSICAAGINYVKLSYQKLYNIPIVITGTSSRVDEQSPFAVNTSHPVYVRKVLSAAGFSSGEIADFIIPRHFEWSAWEKIICKIKDNDYVEIAMPDYLPWKNDEIQVVLERELNWKTPNKNKDHIDCRFASMKNYLKNKQIPHFVFARAKYSQLIRDGQMTREKALGTMEKLLAAEGNKPDEYDSFVEFLGLTPEIIENVGAVSHLDFVRKEDIKPREDMLSKALSLSWQCIKAVKG